MGIGHRLQEFLALTGDALLDPGESDLGHGPCHTENRADPAFVVA